jgi:Tfp pilus assembly protein PilN
MDLKPLLLTKVVKEATAVIVDVQPTEFDVVIMVGRVPQPTHTVSFPSKALSWQEKLVMIRDELDRTIKFYNSNNPGKPLVSSVPIFASIALAHQPELFQSLSDKLGHPVLLLSSPLACPEGLDPNRYMVNIGLALKRLSLGKEAGLSVVNLNVLPSAYRPEPISLTKVVALTGAAVAIGLLVFLVMSIQSASADITSMRSQLDPTNQLLQQKLSQRQELMENITEAEASRDNFTTVLDSLDQQNNGVNGGLEVTVNSLPSTISLSSISHTNSILTINGRSPSEKEVLSYLRKLDASDRFAEITITSMRKIEGKGMDFTLVLRVGGRG